MSITNATQLQTAVANWLKRPGDSNITTNVADFITLAENRMMFGSEDPEYPTPPLRTQEMEVTSYTLTVSSTSQSFIPLPAGFLELSSIKYMGQPTQKLVYMTPNQMDTTYITNTAGVPKNYCIQGGQIRIAPPVADTSTTIVISYYQTIPSLGTNTTNWLLTKSPTVYLSATLLEATLFIGDDNAAAKWARMYKGHSSSFAKQDQKSKKSGDALRMMTDTGNP